MTVSLCVCLCLSVPFSWSNVCPFIHPQNDCPFVRQSGTSVRLPKADFSRVQITYINCGSIIKIAMCILYTHIKYIPKST